MQENKQIFSPVKQNILLFIEYLGISKNKFYEITGVSRGTLDNSAGIVEETLTKIFAAYPQLNKDWVFTKEGSMIKDVTELNPDKHTNQVSETINEPSFIYLDAKERIIQAKDQLIEAQIKIISSLEAQIKLISK